MSKKPLIVTGLLVAAVIGFLLFRPDKLFVDDTVDESLADAFAAETALAATPGDTIPPSSTLPTSTPPASPPPASPPPASPPPVTTPPVTTPPVTTPPITTPPTTEAPGPIEVAGGSFFGIDHRASGTASVYQQDGTYVLRFEDDTDIQNGPDLFVWVTEDTDWYSPGVYLDLGKLKGNVGGQNYALPPEFDPSVHRNVLIWCLRFTTPFAAAELAASG